MNATRARELLTQRRSDLERIAQVTIEQGSSSLTDSVKDSGDLATDALERELDMSVRETAEAGVEDIDRAIARLEEGVYGICPVCKEEIPDERLEARPEAEYCVDHQPAAGPLTEDAL